MRDVEQKIADYYSSRLSEFGPSARGVDWKDEDGQRLRFRQLLRVIADGLPYVINDVGCGYGALISSLDELQIPYRYIGYDLSAPMIAAAKRSFATRSNAEFVHGTDSLVTADYSVASGIFNVKLDVPNDAWRLHIEKCVDQLDRASKKGFAFNCLTSYSDDEQMRKRPDLFYGDPCEWFSRCKQRYSRDVALLHDYGLYEFTVIVRKG